MNCEKICALILAILCCLNIPVRAQTKQSNREGSVILDSSIRYGKLPNGFSYYLKSLPEANSNLLVNFYVKAGMENETPSQIDVAHLIEHLAFQFSPGENPESLKKLGVNRDIFSGSSSLNYTSYSFEISNNNNKALIRGLEWFEAIATKLKFSKSDVNKEKGVMIEELIYGNGDDLDDFFLDSKLKANLHPCRNDYSNFFKHYETLTALEVEKFYNDWYKPDLMAISVVGDIKNIETLEQNIRNQFIGIKNKEDAIFDISCRKQYYAQPSQFITLERNTNPSKLLVDEPVELRLIYRDSHTSATIDTMEGLERSLLWNLLVDILLKRFKEKSEEYLSDFSLNTTYSGANESWPPSLILEIKSINNKEKGAIQSTIRLLNQIRKEGALELEWNQAKKDQLEYLNSSKAKNSHYWTDEIRKHFVNGEALPRDKQMLLSQWLTDLTLNEFNSLTPVLLTKFPDDIGIIAPKGHKAVTFTEKQIRRWIDEVKSNTRRYQLPEVPQELMSPKEIENLALTGFKEHEIKNNKIQELELDNGVKVILYPFKPSSGINDDKIMIHGFRPVGAKCLPTKDYFSAINSSGIVKNTGAGDLDKFQLERYLSNTSTWQGVVPYINYEETGIKGEAKVEDLETLFQLTYLYFTNPGKQKIAFEDWKKNQYSTYFSPSFGIVTEDFKELIEKITGDSTKNPIGTLRFKGIEKTKLKNAYSSYMKLFGQASEFTFIITGDYNPDLLIPLLQKYLGNLSNSRSQLVCKSNKNNHQYNVDGPIFKDIQPPGDYKIENVRYGLRFLDYTDNHLDWKEQVKVKALGELLNLKLHELRYKEGYSLYSYIAGGRFNESLSRYEIDLKINCSISEFDSIQKESKRIINEIKSGTNVQSLFPHLIRYLNFFYSENQLNKHRKVQKRLHKHYRYNGKWIEHDMYEEYVRSLTLKDIVETANKYLVDKNLIEIVMDN